jgi:hypothetical protein
MLWKERIFALGMRGRFLGFPKGNVDAHRENMMLYNIIQIQEKILYTRKGTGLRNGLAKISYIQNKTVGGRVWTGYSLYINVVQTNPPLEIRYKYHEVEISRTVLRVVLWRLPVQRCDPPNKELQYGNFVSLF